MFANNLSEIFNSHVLNYRDLIIELCEGIRGFLMEGIKSRTSWMRKCSGSVGSTIKILIEKREKLSRRWRLISNGKGEYQINGLRGKQFVVYLREKICTCNLVAN
mgnify:CR=1 FL=1